jgi:hypothetical protein
VILDSKNKPVHTGVGNGSIIRFEAYARPFFNASLGSGLQMQLIGVQVRELVPFGQTQPTFGEVDGFVESAQAPAAAPAKTPTPATEPVTGDEEDAPWV